MPAVASGVSVNHAGMHAGSLSALARRAVPARYPCRVRGTWPWSMDHAHDMSRARHVAMVHGPCTRRVTCLVSYTIGRGPCVAHSSPTGTGTGTGPEPEPDVTRQSHSLSITRRVLYK
jgi:hypothetical protein